MLTINPSNNISQTKPALKTTPVETSNPPTQPSFKGGVVNVLYDREITLIIQNLSKDAKTRLRTTVFSDSCKERGLVGWMLKLLNKILNRMFENDKNGMLEVQQGGKEDFQYQVVEDTCANLLYKYMAQLLPNGKGGISLNLSSEDSLNNQSIGKGFKIYTQTGSIELDKNLRTQFVEILENSKNYEEIKNKIAQIKPIL